MIAMRKYSFISKIIMNFNYIDSQFNELRSTVE